MRKIDPHDFRIASRSTARDTNRRTISNLRNLFAVGSKSIGARFSQATSF